MGAGVESSFVVVAALGKGCCVMGNSSVVLELLACAGLSGPVVL